MVAHGKLQEMISECKAIKSRLKKSVKTKESSDQTAFFRLLLKGHIKQALKFVNTTNDINKTRGYRRHQLQAETKAF